ncbi:MAG: malate synthase A [Lysobacterales bacterium]
MVANLREFEPSTAPPAGFAVVAETDSAADMLHVAAQQFLVGLHREFEALRRQCLEARGVRQARFDAGARPDWRADTRAIRAGDWRVAPIPESLLDRRVEITGPTDPKTILNALNSGACVYMADFEDSTAPTWTNLLLGQRSLRAASAGTLEFTAPETGKRYSLRADRENLATLMVRPRGWHLDEAHVSVDGERMSASLFDLGLFLFHNARALADSGRGPYAYLPKIEAMEEAALWDAVLTYCERELGLVHGAIKVTVLIETLPAAFEMHEILHALRTRVVGLNCGRWDYIFSYLKTFRAHRDRILPARAQVTMTQPFLRAYSELLIQTCHRRGAHAMGGMAAQIPIANDAEANDAALARVRADKEREVSAGHDGTWVAHPGLIPLARDIFDRGMRGPHQQHVARLDVDVTREQLIEPCPGTITRAGFEGNIEVCVRYLAAWLGGMGCVPIHHLMEDAATAEIARAQIWQWLHHGALALDDGTPIDFAMFDATLLSAAQTLAAHIDLPGREHLDVAVHRLDDLTRDEQLADFLTLAAYPCIVERH